MKLVDVVIEYSRFRQAMETFDPFSLYDEKTAMAYDLASQGNFSAAVDLELIDSEEAKAIIKRNREYEQYVKRGMEKVRKGILMRGEYVYSLDPILVEWQKTFGENIKYNLLRMSDAPMLIDSLKKNDKTDFVKWQEMMMQRLQDMKTSVGFPDS